MNGIEAATESARDEHSRHLLTAYADERNTLNKAKVTQPYGYIIKSRSRRIDIHTSSRWRSTSTRRSWRC